MAMRSTAAAVLLVPLVLASCAGAPFLPVPERARATAESYAARVAALTAGWEAAGGSRGVRPPAALRGAPSSSAVSAAWWGFDPSDGTGALQAALDSGAGTVVVPRMGSPWIIGRTLEIRASNLEILLEPGVVLLAAEGAFRDTGESLLESRATHDVSLLGYGAAIRMRRDDYQKPPYEPGQWRHGIALRGVARVLIAGLSIESSGGDGVYVGTNDHAPCEDLVLRDLDIRDNHRQGISVISAKRLRVEDCLISGTSGAQPGAGIDFEPNSGDPGFQDCLVQDCRIERNAGGGILLVLRNLGTDSQPISIRLEGCTVANLPVAAWLHGLDRGARGTLTVSGCSFGGIVQLKGSSAFSVIFQKAGP